MNQKGDEGGDKCELFPVFFFFSPVIPKRMGVAFSPIPHVSPPTPPPLKKKKKKLRMEEGEGKNEVNYTTTRLSLQLPPLTIYSVLRLVAPHARRSLHRAHRLQSVGMSAGGNDGTANRPADPTAEEEEEGPSQAGSSLPAVELPRKRKGDVEERQSLDFQMDDDLSRSEGEDQQVKMKCFREPHSQIEKRRRDKMNNLIDELAAMIPACQPMARKLDKLTVLRKAVSHLKALKAGTSSAFTDTTYKPSILPHDDLRQLLLRAADGFLLVVSCDRAKILFTSESVSKILHFSRLELTGQSLFDFVHHKDINKVKEQLASSELYPRQRLIDAATGVQVQADSPVRPSHLTTGARRSFFCRMKHSRVAGKHEDKPSLLSPSKKKESYRYCTLHCTGYMRSWPSSQLDSEGDTEKETSNLTCLVTVCRLLPHASHQPSKDVNVKPAEFVTRCAIDGKFTFVDQRAATVIGYLPQEILGTSCYEYFHQDDLQQLAEKHRQALRSKEKIETPCYKFKTKYGVYVSLQSQWFSFTNPWTKEVEFIVSLNRVISGPTHTKDEEAGSSKALKEDTKQIPIIPSLSSGVGTMIYAGSIGTQIANELIDTYSRVNSSPSSGAPSPFGSAQEKGPLVSPQTSRSASSREEAAGSSSQSHSDSGTAAGASSAASESTGELSQLDLDSMVVPGLSSFSSDEAAMAVIMSLLETDVNMGQSGDFEDLHWPF
ncbi:aryl hydrocarbon receptor nuclear translocator-like protein 2 isoform X6 [Acanthopagrus latus]|uniref:aryl hydrocarbon receptor nuclear translocator-like protein 2 isoform X6 n=1 Tax=Acanthopagrus latus TaxID=8177 RepID=UPI00187BEA99|nr:aryl hydrocarbon receptor nuclear translocator-like protein 2 isoform X6 [Acanthopagrus latus]